LKPGRAYAAAVRRDRPRRSDATPLDARTLRLPTIHSRRHQTGPHWAGPVWPLRFVLRTRAGMSGQPVGRPVVRIHWSWVCSPSGSAVGCYAALRRADQREVALHGELKPAERCLSGVDGRFKASFGTPPGFDGIPHNGRNPAESPPNRGVTGTTRDTDVPGRVGGLAPGDPPQSVLWKDAPRARTFPRRDPILANAPRSSPPPNGVSAAGTRRVHQPGNHRHQPSLRWHRT
jgi:hypothetical protein